MAVIPPSRMVEGAWRLLASGEYTRDILLTLANVAIACSLAVVTGFVAGWLLYTLPRLRRAADPLLASYYAVPTFIFYPLFIVLFGLNRWPLIAIGYRLRRGGDGAQHAAGLRAGARGSCGEPRARCGCPPATRCSTWCCRRARPTSSPA